MRNERRAPTARVLVAAAFAISALAWAPAAIAAPSAPLVTGTVVNGTTGDPVPDLEVTLHLFSTTAELGSTKATTDATGAFSFADITADAKGYQVTAVYKDVLYRNQMAKLTSGKPIEATLKVYEPTTDPANVVQSSWIVWVDQGGTPNCASGACVQHDIRWSNGGDTAYTGSPSSSGGATIATQVPLSAGATNFQFLGMYLDTPGQVQGSTYVNPQPILPGTSSATVRYDVKDITELKLPVTLKTASFQLYVPSGVEVKADGLTASGQVTDNGITYERYAASNLQAGDTIDVSLSGVGGVGGGKNSPILIGIIGGLIVVTAGGLALWKLAGRGTSPARGSSRRAAGRRPAPGKRQQAPARSNGRPGRTAVRLSTPRPAAREDEEESDEDFDEDDAQTEERFDLLIDEIAALDLAHEKGLLQEQTYQALRADAKERLLRLRTGKTGERSSR